MKNSYIKILVISTATGAFFTIALNILSATYFVQEGLTGSKMVLTGLDAIQATIKEFGVLSYIRTLFSYFVVFFLAVFAGCIWFKKWHANGE